MANDNVEVKVSADDTSLQKGLSAAEARTKRFANEQERAADKASKAWEAARKKVGSALTAFGAVGVAGFVSASRDAATFDTNMRKVNVVAKLSQQGFEELSKSVVALSDRMRTTRDINEMSGALAEIYAAGAEGAKAMAILEQGVRAADAGSADLQKTTGVLLTAMKAYNIPAEEAGKVTDILFRTVDRGKISFEELSSTIGPALVTGAKFGISMEEVAAAVAELSLTAPSASEAVTGLERTMVQLGAPTADTEKKLKALGVGYGRSAIEAKGFMGVLKEFNAAAGGSDAELRRLLSSSEALKGSFALTANGGKAYEEGLLSMRDAAGATTKAYDEMAKAYEFSFKVLKKEAKNASVKIGETILPIATKWIDSTVEMVRQFNSMDKSSRDSVIGIGLAATAIGGLTGAFLLLAPQIAALPKALATVRLALVGGGGIGVAIAATVIAIGALSVAWEKDWFHMRTVAENSVNAIREAMIGLNMPGFTPGGADPQDVRARRLAGTLGPRIVGQSNGINLQQARGLTPSSGLKVTIAESKNANASTKSLADEQARLAKIMQDSQKLQADGNRKKAKSNKQHAERHKSEDELRLAMVRQAKALVGLPTAKVQSAMGGAGDEFTQCANTMRLVSKRAGNAFPVDFNPFDKKLLKPGEGVGPAMADSLFGSKVGSFFRDPKQARAGDLAFWEDPRRPGVAQHVEMVDDQGGTIGASSSQRAISQRQGIGDLGPNRKLLGFISPSAYKSGAKSELGGGSGDYVEELRRRRNAFLQFAQSEIDRDLVDLYQSYQDAMSGARNDEERAAVEGAFGKKKFAMISEGYDQRTGLDAAIDAPRDEQALLDQMVEAQRAAYEQRRQLGIQDTEARLQEIANVLQAEQLADETRHGLLVEQKALKEEDLARDQETRQLRLTQAREDIEFERATGQISLEEKLARLQQELVAFEGNQATKRQLLLDIHNTEMQLMAERNVFADNLFANFEQGLQGMLTQSLSSQQSFGDTFKNLWKSLANQVLAEITKMIVKALLLQKILRGIFSFFGGIFGGVGAIASSAIDVGASSALNLLPTAHTGGSVVPGGIRKFHQGGGIGLSLAPDEVLAKLQVGEMVLSRDHVRQAADSPAAPGLSMVNHFHGNSGSEADARHFGDVLGRQVTRRLQEAR